MTADPNYMKRWRAENRERIRQQQAEWRARMTPEKKAAYAERDKQRYASDPEKKREAALAWQRANPERAADRKREWAAENADRIKAQRREKYLANREASIAKSVAWGRANKDKRDAARARCAEQRPAIGSQRLTLPCFSSVSKASAPRAVAVLPANTRSTTSSRFRAAERTIA